MTKIGLSLTTAIALYCVAGCDTGNPSVDHTIGRIEVASVRTLQGVGGAVITAPDNRTKAVGVGMIAGGVALEEDGLARVERADAAIEHEPRTGEYVTAHDTK